MAPWITVEAAASLRSPMIHAHGRLANAMQAVKMLDARHVPLLAGTDAPNKTSRVGTGFMMTEAGGAASVRHVTGSP